MESFEALVARINASAFLDLKEQPQELKRQKWHRLVKLAVETLNKQQLVLLYELLNGDKLLMVIAGIPYAVGGTRDGDWTVCGLGSGSVEHTVAADLLACSCKDCTMRGRECKHLRAVKKVLDGPNSV